MGARPQTSLLLTCGKRLRDEWQVQQLLNWITQRRLRAYRNDTAEHRLKATANACLDIGVMPTPGVLTGLLSRDQIARRDLNGKQTDWRREVLLARGFVRGKYRWRRDW